jgi:hypothetical protein
MIIQTRAEAMNLNARIERIEQDIRARRHLLALRSSGFADKARRRVRYSLASPAMLIAAMGVGVLAQRWVQRNFSRTPEEIELRRQRRIARHEQKLAKARRKAATGESAGVIGRGLKAIAMIRAIIVALPSSWVNALPSLARSKAAAAEVPPVVVSPIPRPYDSAGTQAR